MRDTTDRRRRPTGPGRPDGLRGCAVDPSAPLSSLLDLHDEIDELFLLHQEALLERDFARARDSLRTHAAMLRGHADEEDAVIVPAYATLPEHPRGAAPELYLDEHVKIRKWLEELEAETAALAVRCAPAPRDVLALLDRERTFKHLLEHHDERERRFLYPMLDAGFTAEERARVWRDLERLRGTEARG